MLKKDCVFKGGKDQIFCSAIESDHPGRRPKWKRQTNRAEPRWGREATWMVLTMRPERRKSRPRGSTTSTSGIAMAGSRRRRRRFQSRRVGSGGRRRWRSSPRCSFPGERSASCGGRRWLRRRRGGRGTRGPRIRRLLLQGRWWMDERWEAGDGVKRMRVHGWLGNTRGWCATSDSSFPKKK